MSPKDANKLINLRNNSIIITYPAARDIKKGLIFMRFTLVFENDAESFGSSYDLLFTPNPVWVQGDNLILELNPDSPLLEAGSVHKLMEQEEITYVEKCIIIVHHVGHGDVGCLEMLKKDLEDAGILYKVVDFGELLN